VDPLFDFTGRIVLVTGGSRGLGREMVMAFAERGADVVVASRKLEACEAVAEAVRKLGRRALAHSVHAGRWDSIDELIEVVYGEFGRIDILVNNAGSGPAMASHDVTEALFDSVVGLNFKGPFRLASQVAKRMSDGEGGVIVNVSSSGSLMATPGVVPYASAKAALNAITDIARAWTREARESMPNALRRAGQPSEIVTAALYLASPASSFTTGTLVRVDGGMV
jgi:NAD(P)-dependent dehydrogenase (short-subunit alcohol dehydrogenase family)